MGSGLLAQGTLATNWIGGIYPLEVRLKPTGGSYGSYIVVKDGSNVTQTNPITYTTGGNTYKINIFISPAFNF
jgi:hypothetical protein